MSSMFIAGGSGKVARSLIKLFSAKGLAVSAMHRRPVQAKQLADLGASQSREA